MSENKKNLSLGEPISENQLDAVAGGNIFEGSDAFPFRDTVCWFKPVGEPRADGRIKCAKECRGRFNNVSKEPDESGSWWVCKCRGSDTCVNKWHMPCGNPSKWN